MQTIRLDNIIVVNNGSTDGTKDWLDEQTDLDVIHQENVGGSGGFYRGIEQAYESGYDWIWCMDDDVYPESNCLEKLLEQDDKKTGIICPLRKQQGRRFLTEIKKFNLTNPLKSLHVNLVTIHDINDKNAISIEGITFEGPLIKHEVVKQIGLPNKELFLLYDDSDYGYRTVLAGWRIILVTNAILNKELFFVNDDRVTQVQKGKWKLYYHIRNSVYFNKKYGKNIAVRYVRSFGILIKYYGFVLKNICINKKYGWGDTITFTQAFLDGIKGNLGRREK
jgi:GT2 family glycosyltransferase